MALVLVQGRRFAEIVGLPVDPDADEALLAGRLEDAIALGLAVLDEWAQHQEPRVFRHRQDLVHDLLDSLAFDFATAVRTVRMPDPGE